MVTTSGSRGRALASCERLVTHVEVLQAVDGVLSIQQLVGQVHYLRLHRLLVSLHLP